MRRIGALMIDCLICFCLGMGVIIFLLYHDMILYTSQASNTLIIIYILYIFISDYFFKGMTIGRKCAHIKMYFMDEKPKYLRIAIVHSLCRMFFTYFGIISLAFFFCGNGHMPYEKWLHISIGDKNLSR